MTSNGKAPEERGGVNTRRWRDWRLDWHWTAKRGLRRLWWTLHKDDIGSWPPVAEGHVEASRKYSFFHAYVEAPAEEEDVKASVALPWLGALWVGVKVRKYGFTDGHLRPWRYLFGYMGEGPCDICAGSGERHGANCLRCGGQGQRRVWYHGKLTGMSRETGIHFGSGKARIKLLASDHGSTTADRRTLAYPGPGEKRRERPGGLYDEQAVAPLRSGYEWSFPVDPRDILFGEKTRSAVVPVSEQRVIVPMPEGNYPGTVGIERWTYKRPRSPFRGKDIFHSDLKLDIPIPIPGKGENSWDCEDDFISAQGSPSPTATAAVGAVVNSVMATRARYASEDWVPDAGWPQGIFRR